jgi:hypothetical protein
MKKKKDPRGRKSKGRAAKIIPIVIKMSAAELAIFKSEAQRANSPLGRWLLEPRRKEFCL